MSEIVKPENYINIQGWMCTELGLSGNELLVYAIIFGFSQDGNSRYVGSRKYLAEWCGCTTRSIATVLEKLEAKGLLVKNDVWKNDVKFCEYSASPSSCPMKIFHGGNENFSHINTSINTNIRENVLSNDNTLERKRFVPPTVEEIEAYIKEKGYHFDAEAFWAFYDSNGWMVGKNKMKNWKSACVTWEKKYNGSGDRNSGSMDWLDNWTPDPELTKMFNETRKR